MRKAFIGLVLAVCVLAGSAARAELKGEVIFRDTFYGALTGAIVGGALLVFTDEPQDHLNFVAYGAASGAIIGALFGAYESTAVAEYRDGNLYLALPTVRTRRVAGGVEAEADLLRVPF